MTTTAKSKNIRGPKKPLEGRYIISEFNIETAEPLGPHARKSVQHCGYLVRDRLSISAREWKQKINEPHVSFVSDLDKNLIWDNILQHFTLQADDYDAINDDELKVGYEEDGHTISDLEEIPIHEIRQEEPNALFQY